jgi:photosystem II stability/assembly factor-like uncharacterized protein
MKLLRVLLATLAAASVVAIVSFTLSAQTAPRPPAQKPAALAATVVQPGGPFDPALFHELRWRTIGPYRAGRTKVAAGVPSQPNVFYIGVCNGGVWRTNDYGRTWTPIFDDQPTGSIGAIGIAPSDPNIIYVGSGEGLQRPDLSVGDGIYRTTDAGKTWTHLGLRDGQQIPAIIVDPRNPGHLFVAVLGHPYGANAERGVFKSTDGGLTFDKALYKDENTGASDLEFDPSNPDTIYATMWESRQGPWENAAWTGTGGGIFKSTDSGGTWKALTKGLPAEGVVQADVAVSLSNPKILYASVASPRGVGIYRSDDAGETWRQTTTDSRPAGRIGGGDLPVPAIDPKNPDIVYMASTVTWRSVDGGKTWTGFRGAPGGDDYQKIWINPTNPDVILNVSDQGAIITVNGGQTWSSWYTQPTAQLYHVAADNAFPYRLCSGQQESGSACVASRGIDGQITMREWHPVGVDEYGYAAPDPLDPDIIFGGRTPTRYDRRTAQVQNVGPTPIRDPNNPPRTVRTQPILFSTVDPHVLYFATNVLWKTSTGGSGWTKISPDLTRKTWDIPASIGKYRDTDAARPAQRGVIYTIGPSYMDINRIWIGTDDGLIHVTTDGGTTWKDVTPKELVPWAKVSIIDAGRFDVQTAYAAINTLRLDDLRPHIYRTHDGGKTWTHITNGIPDGATVNAVREDPKRKGLLFASTEREVYASFDDGEHWQSLRQNMPATSVRDLIVKDDDLAVATHGRGFWILDDITPLRQLEAKAVQADAFLFKPAAAWRVRWNTNSDTPIPPDESTGQNPPEGAIINYLLKADAAGPVTLEILDGAGKPIRRYASTDPVDVPDAATASIPLYWYRPPQVLSTRAGLHRFTWDVKYQPLAGGGGRGGGLPSAAVGRNTIAPNGSPWVMPGQYAVKLTVGGRSYTQPIIVKMDPRVKTPLAGLQQQFMLSKAMYEGVLEQQKVLPQVRNVRSQVRQLQEQAGDKPIAKALAAFGDRLQAIESVGAAPAGRGGAAVEGRGTLVTTPPGQAAAAQAGGGRGGAAGGRGGTGAGGGRGAGGGNIDVLGLGSLMSLLQGADVAPTAQLVAAIAEKRAALAKMTAAWSATARELVALNAQLKQAGLPAIALPATEN